MQGGERGCQGVRSAVDARWGGDTGGVAGGLGEPARLPVQRLGGGGRQRASTRGYPACLAGVWPAWQAAGTPTAPCAARRGSVRVIVPAWRAQE